MKRLEREPVRRLCGMIGGCLRKAGVSPTCRTERRCSQRQASRRLRSRDSDRLAENPAAPSSSIRLVLEKCRDSLPLHPERTGIPYAIPEAEVAMRIAIFFATREGHTSKIASRIADDLRAKGVAVDVINVRKPTPPPNWSMYATAFVAASVHGQRHEREMIEFARRYRDDLRRIGAVFISVP